MTPEQARALLSDQGRAAVQALTGIDLAPAARVASAQRARDLFGPALGPIALEQVRLRGRAVAKHQRGGELWWTGPALEQASAQAVSRWRARRFTGPVLDLCCSVGADLFELPDDSVGVDLDQARLLLARANAEALGRRTTFVAADVTTLRLPASASVFVDPARRSGGRRVFDPRAYSPPLDAVLDWRDRVRALVVKVAPGVDYDALPAGTEVEIVSLAGEVKEAVLAFGAARTGVDRSATLLPAGDVLSRTGAATPAVRPPGHWLLDLDGAVVRAHLVAEAAEQVDGWLLDQTIAYVSADHAVPTPWGRWYEVLESFPFGLKTLRQRLRSHDAGPLVVKKRGTAVEPEQLRRALKLTGNREVTVVLTRSVGRQIAMIVRPPGR